MIAPFANYGHRKFEFEFEKFKFQNCAKVWNFYSMLNYTTLRARSKKNRSKPTHGLETAVVASFRGQSVQKDLYANKIFLKTQSGPRSAVFFNLANVRPVVGQI